MGSKVKVVPVLTHHTMKTYKKQNVGKAPRILRLYLCM